jgi:two-component system sensor histidine kinase UhpB
MRRSEQSGAFMNEELKILIVEDVPRDAEAIEQELRNEGVPFRARRLENREEFLAALESFAPDVVLSDFTLPTFDALEALRLLRQHHRDIPFILVTGTRSEEVAVECIKEGADDYILKASLKRLPSSILSVLQKRAAQREQARAEDALRRNEEQFRLIAENSQDLISLLDHDGRFIYASRSYQTCLGYEPDTLIGTTLLAIVHPEDQETLRTMRQESLVKRAGRTVECRLRHRNGEWRLFESVGNWIFDEQGRPQRSVVVARDITVRKRAEEALRELPRVIREAQEAERRRVARELHDSVNQILAAVKFRIHAVEEKLLDRDEATWREALKAKALLEKAMQEVRRISRNLRPSELDDLGLAPAIRSLCGEFTERTRVAVDLSFARLPESFPDDLELNLYRIVQEALANIEQHSGATRVALRLTRDGPWLHVSIRDNGRGFDPQEVQRRTRGGMGLVDMRERAVFLGGTWKLQSAPGAGTELEAQVPLHAPGPNRFHEREESQSEKDPVAAGG